MTRDINIPFDLETTPLEIKTGIVKTGTQIAIDFNKDSGYSTGAILIEFGVSPAKFRIIRCSAKGSWTPFNQLILFSAKKVWRFTKTRTALGIGFMIHCNDLELLDIVISGLTCTDGDWRRWTGEVTRKIFFHGTYDRASDYYRPYQRYRPGRYENQDVSGRFILKTR